MQLVISPPVIVTSPLLKIPPPPVSLVALHPVIWPPCMINWPRDEPLLTVTPPVLAVHLLMAELPSIVNLSVSSTHTPPVPPVIPVSVVQLVMAALPLMVKVPSTYTPPPYCAEQPTMLPPSMVSVPPDATYTPPPLSVGWSGSCFPVPPMMTPPVTV